ncbi:MAG: DUF86 domain-containing protein [Bacteroidales bacterium]|nr:DUF86 domain-containing protein [Bacteroidales bacterium]
MREPARDKNRLEHILQAISKVEEYTNSKTKEYLANNSLYLHATAYNIQIIGEAIYKLSKEFKDTHSETPWRIIEKMRHILVHDYFSVDIEIILQRKDKQSIGNNNDFYPLLVLS